MASVDSSFAGMASFTQNNAVKGEYSPRDQKAGNAYGDVVDNTQNYNPVVQGDKTNAPIKPTQHQGTGGGAYLRSMSMPSTLANTLMNS
jgi:hypothetical protein